MLVNQTIARFKVAELIEEYLLRKLNTTIDRLDIHILALAVNQHADVIVTHNKKDFPQGELRSYGIDRMDPDAFLRRLLKQNGAEIVSVVQPIIAEVRNLHVGLSASDIWRKAWLPQFGRMIEKL